jgi:hypothetical protein
LYFYLFFGAKINGFSPKKEIGKGFSKARETRKIRSDELGKYLERLRTGSDRRIVDLLDRILKGL